MIPSGEEALELHRKYGSNSRIVEHCEAVARVSAILVEAYGTRGIHVDADAVKAAALLHDIGRTRIQTVAHGVEGAKMLEEEGVDRSVVEMVRRHVGAGLSASEAKRLGLPEFDYIPRTAGERIVCFSDKMLDGASVRPLEVEVQRFVRKGHDVQRLLDLRRGIAEDIGTDPEKLVLDKIKASG